MKFVLVATKRGVEAEHTMGCLLDDSRLQDEGINLRDVLTVFMMKMLVARVMGQKKIGIPAHHQNIVHVSISTMSRPAGI